jgi:hypothetical protein
LDPYNIAYNEGIYVKISAVNFYGTSVESVSGNGAVMVLIPDTPVNLQKDVAGSSKSVISFTWDEAAFDGGKPVLDYRITYD